MPEQGNSARSDAVMTDDELLSWYVCGRKFRHTTERAARTGAHLTGKGHYSCAVCDGWHVGAPPSRHVRPGKILKRARAKIATGMAEAS